MTHALEHYCTARYKPPCVCHPQDALPEKQVKTFADVKGCPDAKAELEEVVAFLKHPDRFTRREPLSQPSTCTDWSESDGAMRGTP